MSTQTDALIEDIVIDIKNGDIEAKNELWKRIKRIVYIITRRWFSYANRHLSELGELINIAWFGVERAIKAYDPDKGYKFTSYLTRSIDNALGDFFGFRRSRADWKQSKRNEISINAPCGDEDYTIEDTLEDSEAGAEFENAERRLMAEFVNKHVDRLDEQKRDVIRALYYDNKSLTEIGEIFGVSAERIRQIKQKAFRELKMNKELRAYAVEFLSYGRTGLTSFKRTWTSATEYAVLKLDELRREIERQDMELLERTRSAQDNADRIN